MWVNWKKSQKTAGTSWANDQGRFLWSWPEVSNLFLMTTLNYHSKGRCVISQQAFLVSVHVGEHVDAIVAGIFSGRTDHVRSHC